MKKMLACVLFPAVLAGCGGGGGGSSTSSGGGGGGGNNPPDPEGIYTGSVNVIGTQIDLVAIIAADGVARVYEYGTLTPPEVSQPALSLNLDLVFDSTPELVSPNSSGDFSVDVTSYPLSLTGSISGTVTKDVGIAGNASVSDGVSLNFNLAYDGESSQPASFAAIGGSYTFPMTVGSSQDTVAVTIDGSTGAITATDQTSTCTFAGSTTIPNPATNVYEVNFSINNSCGFTGGLSGVLARNLSLVGGDPLMIVDGTITQLSNSTANSVGVGIRLTPSS